MLNYILMILWIKVYWSEFVVYVGFCIGNGDGVIFVKIWFLGVFILFVCKIEKCIIFLIKFIDFFWFRMINKDWIVFFVSLLNFIFNFFNEYFFNGWFFFNFVNVFICILGWLDFNFIIIGNKFFFNNECFGFNIKVIYNIII